MIQYDLFNDRDKIERLESSVIDDPDRPATPEEFAALAKKFKDALEGKAEFNPIDVCPAYYSQPPKQTPTEEKKKKAPKRKKTPVQGELRLTTRFKSPKEWMDFRKEAQPYVTGNYGDYSTKRRELISHHFPSKTIPIENERAGKMFLRLYASSEKYSNQSLEF